MVTLTVYPEFSKRKNSTKIPTNEGQQIQAVFKEPTDLLSPILRLKRSDWPSNTTYCKLEGFERRYFIKNITESNYDQIIVELEMDELGTFRSGILSTTQFVIRSTSDYDVRITDRLNPAKSGRNPVEQRTQVITGDGSVGGFCLGVIGKSTSSSKCDAVTYYGMNKATMYSFMNYMFDTANFTEIGSNEVVKSFFNPFQYVSTCMFFPMDFALGELYESGAGQTNIQFGWWDSGISGYIPDSLYYRKSYTLNIPRIYSPNDDYRNYEPFSSYSLHVPCCGDIALSPSALRTSTTITVEMNVDYVTGVCETFVYADGQSSGGRFLLCTMCGQMGVPVALAQISQDISGAIDNVLEGVGNISVLNPLGFAGNVMDAVESLIPQSSSFGKNGNRSNFAYDQYIRFTLKYSEQPEVNASIDGKPLYQSKQLSALSGFCQCRNAHYYDMNAFSSELDIIDRYLNGGFYIE